LTLFSCPKPFSDPHIATIQHNAIRSWTELGDDAEVLLVGDEPGLTEAAAEHQVQLLPDVDRNDKGTPLVSSIFDLARKSSTSQILVYINADIIVFRDFSRAAREIAEQADHFLVIGQRWDLDIHDRLDYSAGWDLRLAQEVDRRGRMHAPAGSDYFIFPRSQYGEVPEFAIGRVGWDNWMIFHAHQQGWLIVDGTPSIRIIHQQHDYSHMPDGRLRHQEPEARRNEYLAGGAKNLYMVLDSDKEYRGGRLLPPRLTIPRLLRKAELRLTPPDGMRAGISWSIARQFRRMRRKYTGSL
jgi:hypothetical protein